MIDVPAISRIYCIIALVGVVGIRTHAAAPDTVVKLASREIQDESLAVVLENPFPRPLVFQDVTFTPEKAPLKIILTNTRIPPSGSLSVGVGMNEGEWPEEDVGMRFEFECEEGKRVAFYLPVTKTIAASWAITPFGKASVEGELLVFNLEHREEALQGLDPSQITSSTGSVVEWFELEPGTTKFIFQPDPAALVSPSVHTLRFPQNPPGTEQEDHLVTVVDYKQWDGGIQPVILEPGPDRGAVSYSRLELGSFTLEAIEPHEKFDAELISDSKGLVLKLTHTQEANPGTVDRIMLLLSRQDQELRIPLPVIIAEQSEFEKTYAGTIPTTGRRSGSCGCH